jgi:hypothetical protein
MGQSERCSCWYHAGQRKGWSDDDPCPLHPEARNVAVVREPDDMWPEPDFLVGKIRPLEVDHG